MTLKELDKAPPWEWPENAGDLIRAVLLDKNAAETDRMLAVELAVEVPVFDDAFADTLLDIVRSTDEPDPIRCKAAISLGPMLELIDTVGFDDPYETTLSEGQFQKIQRTFREIYENEETPTDVRRAVLEASVRAPQPWHEGAVRAAYANEEEPWHLTGIFCMRFVGGFETEILEALQSEHPDIEYEAVCAAGNWGLDDAWPCVSSLAVSEHVERELQLAAIEAVIGIRPSEAHELLGDLLESTDEDIVEAVAEALAFADGMMGLDGLDDEFDDDDDDDDDLL